MFTDKIFLAITDNQIKRGVHTGDSWQVTSHLNGKKVNCLVQDPHQGDRIYAGTQEDGMYVSEDSGENWKKLGNPGHPIKSLAASPHQEGLLYAGGKPVSLFVSEDGGNRWIERPALRKMRKWWWFSPADPPGWTPYVQALTTSPSEPGKMLAGIELGGVLHTNDDGRSWQLKKGVVADCHSMTYHATNGTWAYQGGGGGTAFSQDAGRTWKKRVDGLDRRYGWMVAADPKRPEVWYHSASSMPNLLKGEWQPPAHIDGKANAAIYRSVGGAAWEKLAGGLPDPLDYMPYALLTDPSYSGRLIAGLANGDIWVTDDYGDSWQQLPINLGGIHNCMIALSR